VSQRNSGFRISAFSLYASDKDMEGMDGEHLVVNCTIDDQGRQTRCHALIDSGATGYAFIDEKFAFSCGLPLYRVK
jgi:predicted aspartyl protease